MYTSDRRLYLTLDKSRVVEEGDPAAATLLVGEGGQMSDEDAEKYGLTGEKAKAPAQDKAVKSPAENKGR